MRLASAPGGQTGADGRTGGHTVYAQCAQAKWQMDRPTVTQTGSWYERETGRLSLMLSADAKVCVTRSMRVYARVRTRAPGEQCTQELPNMEGIQLFPQRRVIFFRGSK